MSKTKLLELCCAMVAMVACTQNNEQPGQGQIPTSGDSGVPHPGDSGAPTSNQQPRAVVSGLDSPIFVLVDDKNVYFSTQDWGKGGTLAKAPKSGGEATVLASDVKTVEWTPDISPRPFAIDAAAVYYVSAKGLMRVPIAGGTPTKLADEQPMTIVAAPTENSIYMSGDDSAFQCCTLKRIAASGGEAVEVSSHLTIAAALAVDDANAYGLDYEGLVRLSKSGKEAVTIAHGDFYGDVGYTVGQAIEVDHDAVYWTFIGTGEWHDQKDGTVMKIDKAGGAPVVLAGSQDGPWALALDESNVYYTTSEAVWKLSKTGGSPKAITTWVSEPRGLAVDETSVYFADYKDGKILAVAK